MAAVIEHKSIDYVSASERHGQVLGQVPFWFLGNFHFFTIAIGFVGPALGLSFGYTALAGTLGILFGTLFVAFHASQGAELGVPQMIQSRAQFGFRGVVVVLVGTLFTFVGFNIANGVLIGSGLHRILGWNAAAVTIVTAALGALLAIYGHDWLHRVFRGCFVLCLPLYTALSVAIAVHAVAPTQLHAGAFTASGFFAQFAASASYNITYAPSVSDYSRYLPRDTRPRSIIAAVYLGAAASAIWLIILGAWLATRLGEDDGLVALYHAGNALRAGFGALIALASVTALTATIGLNAYSGMLTLVTGLSSLFELRPTPRQRVLCIVGLAIVWTAVALALSVNSIALLFAVLTIMLYLLVPWTSINLIDYFGVRRGHYAITQLFVPHGLYGDWGGRGLAAYLLGVAAELPFFVVPDLYVGPAARALGGVDLGWLVGLIVSGVTYLTLSRRFDPAREAAAIGASERLLAQPR
ncbi:MAG: purine-cytosine permease family protein [Steroidobacteraceae bacterium]